MKKKLNKFDFAVILVLAALVVAIVLKFVVFRDNTQTSTSTTPVTYTMKIQGVRQYTLDALAEGDTIFSSSTKSSVGTISQVDPQPAQTLITCDDGRVVWGGLEGRYDITLTIQVDATQSGDLFRVDTCNLLVNKQASYYTKYAEFSASILSVNPTEAE